MLLSSCGKCGAPTCMVFTVRITEGVKNPNQCIGIKSIENEFCPYAEGEHRITRLTPADMYVASFAVVWPFANAMRHIEKTVFEDANGVVVIACPDGWVQFRILKNPVNTKQPTPN